MLIGFIGLGAMGQPIAQNLVRAGFRLRVHSRREERSAPLVAEGAVRATSIADAARGADIVVTMISDDDAVSEVVLGEAGLLGALAPGAVHLSMSTIGVGLSRSLTAAHRGAGQGYVAAPVFGRPDVAAAAGLWVAVAGAAADVDRCLPLLLATSRGIHRMDGEPVSATALKLACNFLIASVIQALGEAFALLRGTAVPPAELVGFLRAYETRGSIVERYSVRIADENHPPGGFPLSLALKDLRLFLDAAAEQGASMPLASLLEERLTAAVSAGDPNADWSALARVR